MSHVDNWIVIHPIADDFMPAVNDVVAETHGLAAAFKKIDEHAGGNKRMECDVWACAFNHLDSDDAEEILKAVYREAAASDPLGGVPVLVVKLQDVDAPIVCSPPDVTDDAQDPTARGFLAPKQRRIEDALG